MDDVRFALRQLRRRPGFTLTAVLTLAIGMGVNTVAFSVVNGLLFKSFSSKVAEGVGRIATTPVGDEVGYASLQEYERFREATRDSLELGAEGRLSLAWRHDGTTDTAWVLFVSPGYFSMVPAQAIAGQLRVQRVLGGSPSVVIGERFWRQKLGAASPTGMTLRLNNTDVSVAGILPESFTGPAGLYSPDVWLPLDEIALFRTSPALQKRDMRWLFLLATLRPGATSAQVQGQLDAATAMMARDWPDTHKGRGARFRMLNERNSELRGLSIAATIGMGIIGLILLLACFNVANLLLARAVEREREMGIRAALGAKPLRLVRLVCTEGFVLATASGVVALLLAWWSQSLVGVFAIPIETPQHIDLSPDRTMLGFVAALVFISGVLPGLWPALATARINVARVLGSQGANTGGRPTAMRRWLVGGQIAGSTAFLAIAALFIQSYSRLSTFDPGFARNHLVVAEVNPASHGYDVGRAGRYVEAVLERARALPGVVHVAIVDRAPFFIGYERETPVWPAGGSCDNDSCPKCATYAIGPGYLRTMGIPLLEGREFESRRDRGEAVINESFARRQWPGGGGLGETLRIGASGTPVTVVGITAKVHTRGLDRDQPTLFLPFGPEHLDNELTIVARTAASPRPIVRSLVDAALAVDPNVAVQSAKTMADRAAVQLWPFRTLSLSFSICGALAVVLATVGLAGVVIHAVSRRIREFGVRVSVGATPGHLVADVLGSSARLLAPGLVLGLVLAAATARLARAMFVGINVLNPTVYLVVALAQCVIVLLACTGPALRASRVDPLVALRAE